MQYRLLVATIFGVTALLAQSQQDWLNQGIQYFKSARYVEAETAFQRAVSINPSAVDPHLYLANALMVQWIPGADSPENLAKAHRAQAEFETVLGLDSNNLVAMRALASITTASINGVHNPSQREQAIAKASDLNRRITALDPQAKDAYYNLGVLAWMRFYPELMAARTRLGMRPEDPGPINDLNTRMDLRSRFESSVEDGMRSLQKALEIDAEYDDAMAYLNLLIRERADLRDTAVDYRNDVQTADAWVQKALDTKRSKSGQASNKWFQAAPPPPPPPPSPGQARTVIGVIGSIPGGTPTFPQNQIRISGNVQAANLVYKVDPIYPPLAQQARVQGTVRMSVIITNEGRVESVQLVSGHPLLVPAALDAVKKYAYRPTLLNGEPVGVITIVDVKFALE